MKTIKYITIILILCMFVGGASAGITYEPNTCWQLVDETGMEKEIMEHSINKVRGEHELSISLKGRFVPTESEYPVTVYYKTITENKNNPYEPIEHLRILDSYTIDFKDSKQHIITLKDYKTLDMNRVFVKIGKSSITYNAGSDRITILQEPGIGDSWANAINMTWIWEQDQANGWNQIEKIGSHSFYAKCNFKFGSSSEGVYFYDTNKLIQFEWDKIFYVYRGYFKTGDILNQTTKTTYNGCTFVLNTSRDKFIFFYKANCYIYDTTFTQLTTEDTGHGRIYVYANTNTDVRFWSIRINNFYYMQTRGSFDVDELVWYDTIMKNCTYGFRMYSGNYPADFTKQVTVYDSLNVFYMSSVNQPIEIWNCEARGITEAEVHIYSGHTSMFFIDCDFESWRLRHSVGSYSWRLYRQNTINLTTTPNAKITIMDNNQTVYQGYADDNGSIPQQVLNVSEWNNIRVVSEVDQFDSNPYSIEIAKPGYQTYTHTFNLTNPTVWDIGLSPEMFTIPETRSISGLGFLLVSLFGCVGLIIFGGKKS